MVIVIFLPLLEVFSDTAEGLIYAVVVVVVFVKVLAVIEEIGAAGFW